MEFLALHLVKRLLATSIGVSFAICAMLNAGAQTAITTPVGFYQKIADMTTQLLTAPLTPEQREMRHAQNFYQLPAEQRAYYLFAVAYDVGYMVAGQITTGAEPWNILSSGAEPLPSAVLAQRLQAVPSIYSAPVIPAEYSELVGAELFFVNAALQELNVRISGAVANNSSLQQAMYAGAVNSFMWWDWWD